jgi:two-component system, NtrC family, response regulator AtoC
MPGTDGGNGLVLVVDDDAGARKVARANLSLEGFEVMVASHGAEALARLAESDPLAMVSDLKMPDLDGIALMERVHALRPSLPVVLVTAHASVETAVQAMRKGAIHYLTKPIRYDELALVLRHAVAHERARRDVLRLRGELERAVGFEDMVGSAPAIREVFALVNQVAPADATVLLRGETGTGKELVARAIHRRSPRGERPFVAVNCTAVPRDLMESEFFGHEKGAFTGAVQRRIGRFEQAHGSTLFLDEVGDLDLTIQAKLLRVLQEQEITRVGGHASIRVDVRIVAATNRDLEVQVKEGRFRDDLYYRLNVIPLRLPALREKPQDLPALL